MNQKVDHKMENKPALQRLKRIEGQVRGIQKMVDEGRYCADILTQIAAVEEALGGVSKLLLKNHLRHCVTDAVKRGGQAEIDRKYDELVKLFGRHWK
jgi:DNA-binding FrmR family transcriptional regulator